jgi:hypothetical protein
MLLQRKLTPWKSQLADPIGAAHTKLAEYYTRTDGHSGTIYNIACVLGPMQKLDLDHSPPFEPRFAKSCEKEVRDLRTLRGRPPLCPRR